MNARPVADASDAIQRSLIVSTADPRVPPPIAAMASLIVIALSCRPLVTG